MSNFLIANQILFGIFQVQLKKNTESNSVWMFNMLLMQKEHCGNIQLDKFNSITEQIILMRHFFLVKQTLIYKN